MPMPIVINQVCLVVKAWKPMLVKLDNVIGQLKQNISNDNEKIIKEELLSFFQWLKQDNFILLGYLEFEYSQIRKELDNTNKVTLGLCTDSHSEVSQFCQQSILQKIISSSTEPMMIKQLPIISNVHRSIAPYLISVKVFDKQSKQDKILFFIGLFSAEAYHASILRIPILYNKVIRLRNQAHLSKNSHAWREVVAILQNYQHYHYNFNILQY